ncbi:MAG: GNAT family N-acetyltransferase [Bacteroidota bacterium]
MSFTLRNAIEADFPAVLELMKEFAVFQKTPNRVTNTVELMKEEKDSFNCLVVENEAGTIVAFCTFFNCYFSWSGKSMYIDDLYVAESQRGKNIGSMLLNHIIDLAKAENCKKVRWQVSNWNRKAIDFYKSFGAEVGDVEINCELKLSEVAQ